MFTKEGGRFLKPKTRAAIAFIVKAFNDSRNVSSIYSYDDSTHFSFSFSKSGNEHNI